MYTESTKSEIDIIVKLYADYLVDIDLNNEKRFDVVFLDRDKLFENGIPYYSRFSNPIFLRIAKKIILKKYIPQEDFTEDEQYFCTIKFLSNHLTSFIKLIKEYGKCSLYDIEMEKESKQRVKREIEFIKLTKDMHRPILMSATPIYSDGEFDIDGVAKIFNKFSNMKSMIE